MNMTNTLTGDDLKRALFLALYEVKPEKKFVEDIYDMLQTETEKQNMVAFLSMRKNLNKMDVELKALEITEPRYKAKKIQNA